MNYNPQKIEKKWQRIWEKTGIYKTPDKIKGKKNFYHLVMFPYPSGDLHIGHWYNFVGGDVYARLKRMEGFNVMSPMGFDAFGLPAENAAIQRGIHPKTWTYKNIKRMRKQLRSIGAIYDWSREIITCEPEYYKWTQWMFLQLYKKGLAYRAKVPCNFCPSCKTVLANEQVIEGKCERCDSEVVQKEIEQWLFKITAYAEDLLRDLENLDWPETTKIMQRNWIGKSEGWEIKFPILFPQTQINTNQDQYINVFTTRADTLFGCTYLVLAPEHPVIEKLKTQIKNYKFVKEYIEESKKKTERERISEIKEKTGIEIKGVKASNPGNNREIPIWVADYVLIHYGTGAIMAVPAHDQRDFDFARKYNLPIIEVIQSEKPQKPLIKRATPLLSDKLIVSDKLRERAYEGEGILINSGKFSGMKSTVAKERIGEWLEKRNLAKKAIHYKLRDWLISRQRYWGAPIPIIYCRNCWEIQNSKSEIRNLRLGYDYTIINDKEYMIWPVAEKDLPVLLPRIRNFRPIGEGRSPLARSKKFVQTMCPKCRGFAQRETDTMDTFVCSSWYYLRYTDPKNEKKFASKKKLKTWLPVNMYVGGAEHAVMHLLYSRFLAKVLKEMGYIHFSEPFLRLRHQGIILGPDGQKMSKSRGNIIDPDIEVKRYGSDVVRMYLCFMGPYSQGGAWNPKGIVGMRRFLERIWNLREKFSPRLNSSSPPKAADEQGIERLLHQTIKKVTNDIENFKFNTAISALMILVNKMRKHPKLSIINYQLLLELLAPFAPHLTEELWQKYILKIPSSRFQTQNSIHNQPWPKYDLKFIKEEIVTLIIQVNGKVRDKIESEVDISEEKVKELALSREKIQKWIAGKEIKKVIFVPGKLINIVV